MVVKITYFVHGTTTDNEQGLATGWLPGELSELGVKQAKELGKLLADKYFDIVFCSDLQRSVDSARLSFSEKYKIIQDPRLRECNYGDLNQVNDESVVYEEHIEIPFPNGECLKDVEKRMSDFLDFLKKDYDGKHIAIVGHKAPQLALEVLTKGRSWEQAIDEDWRRTKNWQPGWEYDVRSESSP